MGLCRSCWNGTTSALQSEEITSKGTRVSCVSTRKKSGNLWCSFCISCLIHNEIIINTLKWVVSRQ